MVSHQYLPSLEALSLLLVHVLVVADQVLNASMEEVEEEVVQDEFPLGHPLVPQVLPSLAQHQIPFLLIHLCYL